MIGDRTTDGVKEFKDYIIHTYAKDVTRNKSGLYMEKVIGEGKLTWKNVLKHLKEKVMMVFNYKKRKIRICRKMILKRA